MNVDNQETIDEYTKLLTENYRTVRHIAMQAIDNSDIIKIEAKT